MDADIGVKVDKLNKKINKLFGTIEWNMTIPIIGNCLAKMNVVKITRFIDDYQDKCDTYIKILILWGIFSESYIDDRRMKHNINVADYKNKLTDVRKRLNIHSEYLIRNDSLL